MDTTLTPLTPREFYDAALQNAGVTPQTLDIQKVAAARQVPVETAKLAEVFFEQLQKDRIEYTDEGARADDALKLAEAYIEHEQKTAAAAAELACGALAAQIKAAEEYIKSAGLEGQLDVLEVMHIALEEAKTAAEHLEQFKQATFNVPASALVTGNVYRGGNISPHAFDAAAADTVMQQHTGMPRANLKAYAGVTDDAQYNNLLHSMAMEAHKIGPNATLHDGMRAMAAQKSPGVMGSIGGAISRNPGMTMGLAGAGILGAGALYWMHKKRQEENDRQRQLIQAAALPPVSAPAPAQG